MTPMHIIRTPLYVRLTADRYININTQTYTHTHTRDEYILCPDKHLGFM